MTLQLRSQERFNVSFDIINCDLVKPGIFHISEVSKGVHQVIFVLMIEMFLYHY